MEANETYLVIQNTIIQIATPTSVATGVNAKSAPAEVATPLPPLNFSHDPRDNRDVNTHERASFAEIEKVVIIEKQLCDNIISTGFDLCLEIIHLNQPIWRRRMSFGKTSNSNPETTAVRMSTGFIEAANEFYQVDRMRDQADPKIFLKFFEHTSRFFDIRWS